MMIFGKKVLITVMGLIFILFGVSSYAEVKDKLIFDYDKVLKNEEKKALHKIAESIYEKAGVAIKIVTVDDEVLSNYSLEASITDYVEKDLDEKKGSMILMVRTSDGYKNFYLGKANNGNMIKLITQNQEAIDIRLGNQSSKYEEYKLILASLASEENIKKLKKYGKKSWINEVSKQLPYLQLIFIFGLIITIAIITYIEKNQKRR